MNITTTIANGESLSSAIDLTALYDKGLRLFGIVMPSAWTTANITFQMSADGSTYVNMSDQYAEVVASAAASTGIVLDPSMFASIAYLKIRSGTSATPVAQGAARTITLMLGKIQ